MNTHHTCKHPRENICIYIYIYELMTQFSLPISWTAATQFSLPILHRQRCSFCFFFLKLTNLRSWREG